MDCARKMTSTQSRGERFNAVHICCMDCDTTPAGDHDCVDVMWVTRVILSGCSPYLLHGGRKRRGTGRGVGEGGEGRTAAGELHSSVCHSVNLTVPERQSSEWGCAAQPGYEWDYRHRGEPAAAALQPQVLVCMCALEVA